MALQRYVRASWGKSGDNGCWEARSEAERASIECRRKSYFICQLFKLWHNILGR
jgi:hypothetical protein